MLRKSSAAELVRFQVSVLRRPLVSKQRFRFVERSEVHVTRPALERAGWKCEQCPSVDGLRVVEFYRGRLVRVLCGRCRMRLGWTGPGPVANS